MNKFKLIVTTLWVYWLCPAWSFIINLFYFIKYINKYSYVQSQKNMFKKMSLNQVMNIFKWKADKLKDWIPWVYNIIINDLYDDCDGAAIIAKYWYKENNIHSRLGFLYNNDFSKGHCICIKEDNTEFISNNQIIKIKAMYWKQDILRYFNHEYTILFERF